MSTDLVPKSCSPPSHFEAACCLHAPNESVVVWVRETEASQEMEKVRPRLRPWTRWCRGIAYSELKLRPIVRCGVLDNEAMRASDFCDWQIIFGKKFFR